MGKLSNAALRLTTGALVLDAGIKKLGADEGTYAYLQQMAASGVPAHRQARPQNLRQTYFLLGNRARRHPADPLYSCPPRGCRADSLRREPHDHVLPQPRHA